MSSEEINDPDLSPEKRKFISEVCVGRAIDVDFCIRRLAYGSFCFPRQKVFYMEVPKAGCTAMKHTLLRLIGGSAAPRPTQPYSRESTLDMLIHQRRDFPCPTLLELEDEEMRGAIGGREGWLTLAVVRNPFSRIVSFFNDKVRRGEPGYLPWHERYIDDFSDEAAVSGFRRFVEDLGHEHMKPGRNPHLVKQVDLLLLRMIDYSHVFKLEDTADLEAVIRERFCVSAAPMGHLNRSAAGDWRRFYDEAAAGKIARLYSEDFERLGYAAGDWQARASAGEADHAECEALRKQVFDRNRMVEHLHTLLAASGSLRSS